MFIEFADFVVALEAPTGWLELHEVPASNFVPGSTSASVSEEFIRLIKERVPGKPIRYVVLSHFHGDHAGGLRPFIAEGATIITTSVASDIYERAVRRPHTLHPDRLRGSARRPQFEIVSGKRVISDGSRQMVVMEVTSNPHCDGMLVTWLPRERMIYVQLIPSAADHTDLCPTINNLPSKATRGMIAIGQRP